MTRLEKLLYLNKALINEMPEYKSQASLFAVDEENQWKLFRSLVNVRPPKQATDEFLLVQDDLLQTELKSKGITDLTSLTPIKGNLYLWQGDITTLKVDAIVNAANDQMLGCFVPCHSCIDNAIHTFSGIQLRIECNKLMKKQGFCEPIGNAKITKAYNLPCKNVIHTVGPIITRELTNLDCNNLASCYESCLTVADKNDIKSIAFCCISTGEFHFPNKKAAEIAVNTVSSYLNKHSSKIKVVFNVFKDIDLNIYNKLLK